MFNTSKTVFLALAACIAFASCKKDPVTEPATAGTAIAPSPVVADAPSYFVAPNGETYTYVDTTGKGIVSTSISSKQNVGDTTIDEKTFAKVTGDGSHISNYQHSADGVTTMVTYNGTDKITTTVLKANEPVGTEWTDNFTNAGIPTSYKWQIAEKGISRNVMGITYANVIKVHLLGTATIGTKTTTVANADYFYAPNVGLIENISYNPASGATELHRVFQKKSK